MDENKSGLYIVGIVAILAVVALVVLVLNISSNRSDNNGYAAVRSYVPSSTVSCTDIYAGKCGTATANCPSTSPFCVPVGASDYQCCKSAPSQS